MDGLIHVLGKDERLLYVVAGVVVSPVNDDAGELLAVLVLFDVDGRPRMLALTPDDVRHLASTLLYSVDGDGTVELARAIVDDSDRPDAMKIDADWIAPTVDVGDLFGLDELRWQSATRWRPRTRRTTNGA